MIATGAALERRGHPVTVIHRPAAVWTNEAAEAGLTVLPAAMTHDLSVASVAAVAAALRRSHAEVVVACNQRSLRLGALAARIAGSPPVLFRCGLAGSFRSGLYNRSVARGVTHFVVNAASLAAEL